MSETIRAKWVMDGATTLPEAAAKLRAMADELDALHACGWRLEAEEDPLYIDCGYMHKPGGKVEDDPRRLSSDAGKLLYVSEELADATPAQLDSIRQAMQERLPN